MTYYRITAGFRDFTSERRLITTVRAESHRAALEAGINHLMATRGYLQFDVATIRAEVR